MNVENLIKKITDSEYNLTLSEFKHLPLEAQENTEVVEKLIDCCFKDWSKKQRVKFFTKYPMLLRYAPITLQKQYHTTKNFKYLSEYVQNFFIKEEETNVAYASIVVQSQFLYNNPDKYFLFNYATQKKIALNDLNLLKNTSEEVQIDIVKSNFNYLRYAHTNSQDKFVKHNPNYFKYTSLFYQSEVADISTWNLSKLKEDVLKDFILKSPKYDKDMFVKLIENLQSNKKSQKLIYTAVKYSDPSFVSSEILDKFMELNSKNKNCRKFRNSKLWQSILENTKSNDIKQDTVGQEKEVSSNMDNHLKEIN